LQDNDNGRYAGQTFSVTTSWNRVSLTFVGDTSGAFDDDNAESLRLNIWLHAGATYTGGTFTSNTWQTTDNQRLDDITSFFDSTDRTIFITGWQMEVGSQATPFEHRSFGEELLLCQRYFYKIEGTTGFKTTFINGAIDGTTAIGVQKHQVEMRSAPSYTQSGNVLVYAGGTGTTKSDLNPQMGTKMYRTLASSINATSGEAFQIDLVSGTTISFDADL